VIVRVSQTTFELTAADVARHMTRSTAVVVTSAVSYPHGTLDDILGIAALCQRRGVLVHVDACLGGFVLPFLPAIGRSPKPWHFGVPGVTSMSIDVHKYGQAHKGTSVVMYASSQIRRCQYTTVTEWTGGLYISPGLAGSRCAALCLWAMFLCASE
jgi:sphinganine-1-phosphate aldolase